MHNRLTCIAYTALLFTCPAVAAPILLDFEGVGSGAAISEFYNGGTDSTGRSGPNYGISFSTQAYSVLNNVVLSAHSGITAMAFWGGAPVLNHVAGFDTEVSFFYSSPYDSGAVSVYSGTNKTGDLLGTIELPPTTCCNYREWHIGSLSFDGTAKSIEFRGNPGYIAFDDVALNSVVASVPEPQTWSLVLVGLTAVIVQGRRRRATAKPYSTGD